MLFRQSIIRLRPRSRGFHLITSEVAGGLPDITGIRTGILQLFLQHTSASLTLNENADPDVRDDMERWARHAVPDGASYFAHTTEGDDDMPAHIKSSLMGTTLMIPIREGRLALGTWQGVFLFEHRSRTKRRRLLVHVSA